MKRFCLKYTNGPFVAFLIGDGIMHTTPFTDCALSFRTRFAAEMFVRFLATITDSKMSVVEI